MRQLESAGRLQRLNGLQGVVAVDFESSLEGYIVQDKRLKLKTVSLHFWRRVCTAIEHFITAMPCENMG